MTFIFRLEYSDHCSLQLKCCIQTSILNLNVVRLFLYFLNASADIVLKRCGLNSLKKNRHRSLKLILSHIWRCLPCDCDARPDKVKDPGGVAGPSAGKWISDWTRGPFSRDYDKLTLSTLDEKSVEKRARRVSGQVWESDGSSQSLTA